MTEENIIIREIEGSEVNILNAENDTVKLNKTGIFICKEGEATVVIDGVEYEVKRNSIIAYFSFCSLHISSHSKDLKGMLIGADLELLQPLFFQTTNFNALFVIKKMPMQTLSECQMRRLHKMIQMYGEVLDRHECESKKMSESKQSATLFDITEKQLELLTEVVILEVIQCYANLDIEATHTSRKDEVLQKFITMLYRMYRKEHEVSYYASQQCLTTRYFSAIIKEKSGKSPSEWIATALLVDARKQLSDTNQTIKEVSDLLCFPNQSYFGKWFKNLTGVSPLDYRYGKMVNIMPDHDLTDVIQRGISYVNGE